MTTRLTLYNGALLACGERELSSTTDSTPSRRYLDQAWNADFTSEVLNAGQWKFATRNQQLSHETSVTLEYGHSYAFLKPADHVRTTRLCVDAFYNIPLTSYDTDTNYFYASVDPIYISYVSNDTSYGGDLSKWPPDFTEYVRLYLAWKIIPRLNGNKTDLDRLKKDIKLALRDAKSSDAMEGPTAFPPTGSWVNARQRGRTGYDRGSRTSLIG